ncbi:calcium-binding protein [Mesorhizobium sp. BAC0120]|uniref:calcium-binding protein n=1 Tax=Mesorhizobium sp. BAC0120 TaxID=3090670 RepID=UPI00298BCCB8|nr:calcium-binding protein [Mesorhizobium sp. BAC0120]MDW6021457.1 calcium-binding protein [Mesorhizobium sp. BAC0120]
MIGNRGSARLRRACHGVITFPLETLGFSASNADCSDQRCLHGETNGHHHRHNGNDNLSGIASETNHITGLADDDTLLGGMLTDLLIGGFDNDRLEGGFGDDALWGEEGNDQLFGDAGDDMIDTDVGDDVVHGGARDDDTLHHIGKAGRPPGFATAQSKRGL